MEHSSSGRVQPFEPVPVAAAPAARVFRRIRDTPQPAADLPTAVDDLDDDIDVDAVVRRPAAWPTSPSWSTRNARERPDDIALVEPGDDRRSLTWAEIDAGCPRLVAAGLARHGVLAGHRLALRGPTSISYVLAYLAALRAGVVAVPMGVAGRAASCPASGSPRVALGCC